MNTLILDNYDSFTYNLVHIVRHLGEEHEVHRNDQISADEVDRFDRIILSPGPGIPDESGNLLDIIDKHIGHKPILGICLGHQAIAQQQGAQLENMDKVYHGLASRMRQTKASPIFTGVPEEFSAGRYHSWKVAKQGLPSHLEITAVDEQGDIMAYAIPDFQAYGIQFHPESIMTKEGALMIQNFLNSSL